MKRALLAFLVLIAFLFIGRDTWGKSKIYAIVMGNNAPPVGKKLEKLYYADDDAVRYYNFFCRFSDRVYLLTLPDSATQKRYPEAVASARLPTVENFKMVSHDIAQQIHRDRAKGIDTTVYVTFSGHGLRGENGDVYLALSEMLTHKMLFDTLRALNADFIHLFIDACYAEGIVGMRGMFEKETDPSIVDLSMQQVSEILSEKRAKRLPMLGYVISSSKNQKTHEWSEIESGIFTHEVLSGLYGPADVNRDGKIEYSELAAFISAANRDVSDSRGRIHVIAKPPDRNHNVPLVDLQNLSDSAFLKGDISNLNHFYIDLENGERYLDANIADETSSPILLPTNQRIYIMSHRGESEMLLEDGQVVDVHELAFKERSHRQRGNLDDALKTGLFSASYGKSYYQGFVDSTGCSPVAFKAPAFELTDFRQRRELLSSRKRFSLVSFALAGAASIGAIVFGALALNARDDFSNTRLQRESRKINERYNNYTTAFWPLAAVVPVALAAGGILMPKSRKAKKNRKETVTMTIRPASLILGF